MRINSELKSWIGTVTKHLPHLSKPQARVLAMWSFGMVMTRCCGLTTVATGLAHLLNQKPNSVRSLTQRMVSAGSEQERHSEPRVGCDNLLCAPIALDSQFVAGARKALSFSDGRFDIRATLHGSGY